MSRASRQSRPKSNYGFGKTQPVQFDLESVITEPKAAAE
jgi:hypothetical protein